MSCKAIETSRGWITIRRTTAEDAQTLRALRLEGLTNHPTSFGTAAEEIDKMDWTHRAAGDANEAMFVAEHDGTDVAALKWDGRYHDELLMSRWLTPPSEQR